ncbi:hypothetical protein HQ29_02495 [Porphyromonas canoris]|nr:hypothetical protein HQ29_02495 [Porphyromonas canoris]
MFISLTVCFVSFGYKSCFRIGTKINNKIKMGERGWESSFWRELLYKNALLSEEDRRPLGL